MSESSRHARKVTNKPPKPANYTWEKVLAAPNKYQGLLDLQPRTEEACAEIEKNKYFRKFVHKAMGFFKGHPQDLKAMITDYPSEIQMAFFCMSSDPKPKNGNWASFKEASRHQKWLAIAVCLLMQRIGITEGIPQEVKDAAAQEMVPPDSEPSPDDDIDPELMKQREDGRIIYIVMLNGQDKYFKLGTFFLEDGCIYDRWEDREKQRGIPWDLAWDREKLKLLKFVYTRPELGDKPDEIIHNALKKAAKDYGLPETPHGEFHHMGMFCKAADLMEGASVDTGPSFEDTVPNAPICVESIGVQTEANVEPVPAPMAGPSLEDLKKYNQYAKLRKWPLVIPSPEATGKYNEWAEIFDRPLLPAVPVAIPEPAWTPPPAPPRVPVVLRPAVSSSSSSSDGPLNLWKIKRTPDVLDRPLSDFYKKVKRG